MKVAFSLDEKFIVSCFGVVGVPKVSISYLSLARKMPFSLLFVSLASLRFEVRGKLDQFGIKIAHIY
jgi:hypothetical protein